MKKPHDRIIFPLDVPSVSDARQYLERLSGHVGMFKVGLELFIRSGPEIIHAVRSSGPAGIFLDLKLHDIPQTVHRAMQAVADLGVTFITVHCGENPRMLTAAVEGGKGKVGVLGVTVLTSVSGDDIQSAGFSKEFFPDLSRLVLKRAAFAKEAGCIGVVCSGLEVKLIRDTFGKDFVTVTPGIRPAWVDGKPDDQKRVTTPARAIRDGADYLVIGRPIRNAADPRAAAGRIAQEIESVCAVG